MTFKIGDTVYLKSGSPAMTVTDALGLHGKSEIHYDCAWFAGKKNERARFPENALTGKDPDSKE